MASARLAAADAQASPLSGRWIRYHPEHACRDASCRLAYDFVRCGDGWCGVEVKENKTCGRIAFRLDAGMPTQFGVAFSGRYERAEGTQPYLVKASLRDDTQPRQADERRLLSILGNTEGDFQPMRRTYPLHMVLVRDGDATCPVQSKVS